MVISTFETLSFSARPRPPIDSDAEPFCAGCHASVSESHHPKREAEASKNEAYTTKHYKVWEKGVWGFRPVDPEQHKQFLEQAIKIGGKESYSTFLRGCISPIEAYCIRCPLC